MSCSASYSLGGFSLLYSNFFVMSFSFFTSVWIELLIVCPFFSLRYVINSLLFATDNGVS